MGRVWGLRGGRFTRFEVIQHTRPWGGWEIRLVLVASLRLVGTEFVNVESTLSRTRTAQLPTDR
jgi:hypothetical protein